MEDIVATDGSGDEGTAVTTIFMITSRHCKNSAMAYQANPLLRLRWRFFVPLVALVVLVCVL